jgi:RDD family
MRHERNVTHHSDTRDVALGLAVACTRAGVLAGRLALIPLRLAAQSPVVGHLLERTGESLADAGRAARTQGREQLEAAAGVVLESPEAERVVDRALAGPLPEAIARSLIERQVLQRIAEQVMRSAELDNARGRPLTDVRGDAAVERLIAGALESRVVSDVTDQVIESAEIQRLIEEIGASPAVRTALTRQTTTFADEASAGLRRRLERLDDAMEGAVHGRRHALPAAAEEPRIAYGGLSTRGTAFAIDLAITAVIFLVGAALVGLVAQLVGGFRPFWVAEVLAAVGWSTVVAVYLVSFWTVTGQTLGMHAMRLRLIDHRGAPPSLDRSLAGNRAALCRFRPSPVRPPTSRTPRLHRRNRRSQRGHACCRRANRWSDDRP